MTATAVGRAHWLDADQKCLPLHAHSARLLNLMLGSGLSEHKLLRGSGLFAEDLSRPGLMVSPQQVHQLLRNARRLIQDPELSFRWGTGFWPGYQGAVSEALASASCLREALQRLSDFRYALSPLLIPRITTDRHYCYVQWLDGFGAGDEHAFLVQAQMAALNAFTQASLPELTWRFFFTEPVPASIAAHQVYLGEQLQFSAGVDVMVIERDWLDVAWHSDAASQRFTLAQAAPAMTLSEAIYERLHRCLLREEAELPGLTVMAAELHMSPATLKRRLSRNGISYQGLQDAVRLHRSLYCMHVQGWSNEQIAAELKSGGVANFRRAFRRWTGQTPSASRAAVSLSAPMPLADESEWLAAEPQTPPGRLSQ